MNYSEAPKLMASKVAVRETIAALARLDLQSKYRSAMAAGNLSEMSALAEQIELLNRAARTRRSTQKMLAVAFALDPSGKLAGQVSR